MIDNYTFKDFKYEYPNFEEVQKRIEEGTNQLRTASSYEQFKEIIKQMEDYLNDSSFMMTIAYIRSYQDNSDTFYQEEAPKIMSSFLMLNQSDWTRAIIESPYAKDLTKEYGEELLLKLDLENRVSEHGKEDQAKEQQLIAKYQQLKAGITYEFNGQTLSEAQLNKFNEHTDREIRRQAKKVYYKTLLEHKEEFASILDELVLVRNQIAKANGFENYLDYMNAARGRNGYGEKELTMFCEQVKKDLVPFYHTLHKAQAKRLGIDKITLYDRSLIFPDGNAKPYQEEEKLMEAAKKMYHSLSKETGEFFDAMLEHELIDIKASKNKISNMGFCTSLDPLEYPFVFGNCNGTLFDVIVLTHEMGHAFQFYLTRKNQQFRTYYEQINDIVEIPSKAMEQFTYPYAELFVGEDADKFRISHVQEVLEEVGAYCAEHEFETYLYLNPNATTKERAQRLLEIEKEYFPDLDVSEFEDEIREGAMLFRNMLVYMFPRFGISYSLSDMAALEFKVKAEQDMSKAWEDYIRLLSAGGSKSYKELLALAHLSLPFEEGAVLRSTSYAKQLMNDYIAKEV